MDEIEKIQNKIDEISNKINNLEINGVQYKIFIEQFAKIQEQQLTAMQELTKTIIEIQYGFRELNQKWTDNKSAIEKINKELEDNEEKHKIDTRDIQKNDFMQKLIATGGIAIGGAGGGIGLIKLVEFLMSK